MKFNELFNLMKKYDISDDVKILSDSGWECCETDVNGIYYSKKHNAIILTQDREEDVRYIQHKADKLFSGGDVFEDLVYLK